MTRYCLHSSTTNHGTVEQVVGEVRRVAEAGLGGYWAPMLNGLDTMTALGVAAALVPDVEVGTAVVPIPLRSPYALAQQALTVAELSGGRLTLGLGTSHRPLAEGIFRAEWTPPLATMTTYLAELRDLMAGGQPERMQPRIPSPQVVLGAVNPRMAAVAAEHADGVVTWAAGPRTIEQVIAPAAASRTTPFRIIAAIPLCVTSDPDKVRAAIARKLGANDALPSYRRVLEREGVDGIASVAIVGDEGEVVAGLRRLTEAGVTEVAAHVVARGGDEERTWALLTDLAAQRSRNSLDDM
ncbi:LLM class flavin-dependent oxidoreductase [Aeromicrobium choanae]|uniref:F420-dependent oxidoreductase, MSMEG_4879 family n=1 Tax=Aeromicrobium choanae TaxID=1736691 RepID=A0A1T4YWG4_9ACTN|nr:LLM class flavin-dependent oxidoreductase [Aeromicrobium choanae]SKB06122.1 F420-dependent oxidoreductase, MSMEG_4879 family [Aeromicrobium choanae]